jgi:hypothetical protein
MKRFPSLLPIVLALACPIAAWAGPPLETETARLAPRGAFATDFAFEHQTSSDGTETAVPIALEYGLTDRIELLAEPVPYSAIHPDGGDQVSGAGDLEMTVTGLLAAESGMRPALAVAGEVKFPTANDPLIGSGKADYTGYLIASSRHGRFDTHGNVGYTLIGHPSGVTVNDVWYFALGEEVTLSERFDLLGEIFGNTSALAETPDGGAESSVTPEIGGSEAVGMLGVRYHPWSDVACYLSMCYDNNQALLVRPGVTVRFR